MIAYRYDGTFAGFLTCVWDALEGRIEPAAFLLPDDGGTFWETRELAADRGRAGRLYGALARRVSSSFQKLIARGFLTCLPEKELDLLALIRRGLREGDRVRLDLSDPVMARVNLALTKMWTEWDHLKGFVRFSDLDGFLVGEIEPKNRVLPLLAPILRSGTPGNGWRSTTAPIMRFFSPTGGGGSSCPRRTSAWVPPRRRKKPSGPCGGGIIRPLPLKGGSIPNANPPTCLSGTAM